MLNMLTPRVRATDPPPISSQPARWPSSHLRRCRWKPRSHRTRCRKDWTPLGVTETVADPGFSPHNWGFFVTPLPNGLITLAIKGVTVLTTYLIWDESGPSTDWDPGSDYRITISNWFCFRSFDRKCFFLYVCFIGCFKKPQIFAEGVFDISNNKKTNSSTKWLILVWNYLAFYCRSLWSTRPKYGNIWNAIFNTTHTHT